MHRPDRRFHIRDTVLLSGWLFADLLLALAVIFLSANTVGVKPAPIPTPTQVAPPPTSMLQPRLELNKHRIEVSVDAAGLRAGSPQAINDLKQKVRAQTFLQKRTVGLVIAYDGANTVSQIEDAQNTARKVMELLASLGREGFAFTCTSYYDPLYVLGADSSRVTIDLYLFTEYIATCPFNAPQ